MTGETQLVILHGGSLDGEVVEAHLPDLTYRRDFAFGEETWSEVYWYHGGGTVTEEHPEHGRLPVMSFLKRVDVGEE